jgi:predicted lipoprotein
MKKLLSLILPLALPVAIGLTSCSDSDEPGGDTTARETTFQNAANAFVTNTVRPTYKGMADAAIALYNDCVTISEHHAAGTLTTADITTAANDWKESRRQWELSEAFLFGPAGDYNIDPHIDSWPLDKDAMDRLLTDIRNGAEYSIDNNFGYGLLGFHSIEYMLFELSADETTSSIHSLTYTTEEIKYLLMVAEDLRNQCVYLEACWAGEENISQEKLDILEEAELGVSRNYGDMMITAGQAGSIYKTYQETAEEIIQGCIDIADEVGNQKIGRPVLGASDEDKNYIESPYSLNSIEDFKDNIRSIRNSYFGSNSGDASISDYIKSVNPTLNSEVSTAIDNAINAIDAIPEPFAKNANTQAAKNAVTVVGTDLVNTLNKVYTQLSND